MLKLKDFLLFALFILLATACTPALLPSAPVVEPVIPVTGTASVQSVEIEIVETNPIVVNAIIRGQLPDAGCTKISGIEQARVGNTIHVTVTTVSDPVALCAQVLTPFEQTISLDVDGLAPGNYMVSVHGIEKAFYLPTHDADRFKESLVQALNARDYDRLQAFMDSSFLIGYWLSEGTSNAPEQAIELLQRDLLASSSPVTADPRINLMDLLGTDPYTILGAEVVDPSPLFTTGWGSEGKDEAILFVARRPSGEMYWHGLLFAKDGFAQLGPINQPSTPVPTEPSRPAVQPETQAIPTITILSVVEDESVTIRTSDFPADTRFEVRMGKSGTAGVDGILVESFNSRNGGSFIITFEIPEKLHQEERIAIRLESSSGYYSYNWFENETFERPQSDYLPTDVEYVMARQDLSIHTGPSKNYRIVAWVDEGEILRVIGISPDGRWYRVSDHDRPARNYWVRVKFTRPVDPAHY